MTDNKQLDADALTALQNQAAALESQYNEERDIVNQLLGQAQIADAFGKFSQTVWSSKLAYVKENKLYKALAGQKTPNGLELKGTWVEFCELLGCSDEKANQDIANLKAFGEKALESMSNMGIGYRQLRQFRKLPADEKNALIEVAKQNDKDSFIELAEDIISKHAKEKEQLTSELENTKADYSAQSELLQKRSNEATEARLELEKNKKRIQSQPIDESVKELRTEITHITYKIEATIAGELREGFSLLNESDSADHSRFMVAQIKQIEMQLLALREAFALPDDIDASELDWLDEVDSEEQKDEEQLDLVLPQDKDGQEG